MKSKIEVRQFAANIAAHVVGVTNTNFIGFAKEVEAYVLGGAELPETEADDTQKIAEMLSKFTTACKHAGLTVAEPVVETPQGAEEHAEAFAEQPAEAAPVYEEPVAEQPVYDGRQQA